jgi:2-methylcitrate dehydratase PrpD
MSGQSPTVSERLASLLARPVSDEIRARARLHLLDWCACAVAGLAEPAVQPVMRLVAREGSGPCRVLGGLRSGPLAAVLVNGPLGAVLEMDDVDKRALLHPGPVVVPAALAVAEVAGITDGDALLDAIVRGYEAMIRVGRAAGASHYRNHHATGTCGTFGAAAAGASLLGLDPTRTAWALGAAGQQAAGLWQVRHEPGLMKAFHDGRAASNGVAGALLASDGFVAPLRVFEGPQGFFAALAPEGDPEAILTGEGDPWRLWDVSFKPHAACRHAHPPSTRPWSFAAGWTAAHPSGCWSRVIATLCCSATGRSLRRSPTPSSRSSTRSPSPCSTATPGSSASRWMRWRSLQRRRCAEGSRRARARRSPPATRAASAPR